ncbi:hypothetical protein AJ80_03727 [Polytolypa hystricis UAMH7299]|uniref:Uncharacterized protein n=1 Tax=Polytolypa hystricis (strain UAMH7299) TaxID=1447883 RepID=A0A2B7YHI3_POLH7|nr:hypothetical protein AJ80_03727 [Polytolypa hystricis UAMH7299]
MPFEPTDDLVRTEYVTLASGYRISTTSVSPLLQELEAACQSGAADQVQQILERITPLPAHIPGKAQSYLARCLGVAVEQQHHHIVRAMLQRGFLPYLLSNSGIHAAFQTRNTSMLKTFIECGWDVNETGPDMSMRPLLRHAVNDALLRSFLLAHGGNPNTQNSRGLTTLETAAQWSSADVVKELLDYGGDPTADDCLIHAAEVGRLDIAKLFVERGANVNALEKVLPHPWGQRRRRTALDAAIQTNNLEMVEWLEAHGATARNV